MKKLTHVWMLEAKYGPTDWETLALYTTRAGAKKAAVQAMKDACDKHLHGFLPVLEWDDSLGRSVTNSPLGTASGYRKFSVTKQFIHRS